MVLVEIQTLSISQLPSAELIAANPENKYVVGLVAKVMCFYRDPQWVKLRPGVLVVSDYTENEQLMDPINTPNEFITNGLVVPKKSLLSVSVPHSYEEEVNRIIEKEALKKRIYYDYEKFNSCLVHKSDMWVVITIHLKLYEGQIEGILMDDIKMAPSNLGREGPDGKLRTKTNEFIYEPQFLDDEEPLEDSEPIDDDIDDSGYKQRSRDGVNVSDIVRRHEVSDEEEMEETNNDTRGENHKGDNQLRENNLSDDNRPYASITTSAKINATRETSERCNKEAQKVAEIGSGLDSRNELETAPDRNPSMFVLKHPTATQMQLQHLDLDAADGRVYEVEGWVQAFHPIPFVVRPFGKTARAMPIKIFLGSKNSGGQIIQLEVVEDQQLALFWGVTEIEAVVAQIDLLERQARLLIRQWLTVRIRKCSLAMAGAERAYWRIVSSINEMV